MSTEPRVYKPPEPLGRSVVAAEFLPPEHDGQVRALVTCDCGGLTDLTVQIGGTQGGTTQAEAAFTCSGCGTSHWFTVRATGGGS